MSRHGNFSQQQKSNRGRHQAWATMADVMKRRCLIKLVSRWIKGTLESIRYRKVNIFVLVTVFPFLFSFYNISSVLSSKNIFFRNSRTHKKIGEHFTCEHTKSMMILPNRLHETFSFEIKRVQRWKVPGSSIALIL